MYFVKLNENGFISSWSTVQFEDSIEVQASDEVVGLLNCVEVKDGLAILNPEEQEQQIKNVKPDEFEVLKKENADLKLNQEIQNQAIAELGEIISTLGGE